MATGTPPKAATPPDPATPTPPAQGVANNFVSPQTALSLPVASGAITLTWQIAARLVPNYGTSAWVPVCLSMIVGILFFCSSDPVQGTFRDKAMLYLSAFFNTVFLAASVLGLSTAVAPTSPPKP
ncbi:MAG: hypothetical protein NT069_03980 [Planctomycetota bacterium]|nr:hypothetical protein [Planctomycetota bacterium]